MAWVSFLFGNRFASGFKLGTFQADLTIQESHERIAEVTDFPVEDGSVVSDHVTLMPERLTLVGFVTDSPAAPLAFANGASINAFEALTDLWKAREPLKVITAYKEYSDMVITRLILPKEQAESITFTVELKHVRIIKPKTVQVSDSGFADIAAGLADVGKQTASPSSATTESSVSSLLAPVASFFGF